LKPKLPSLFETSADNEPVLEESVSMNTRAEMVGATPISSRAHRSDLERYSPNESKRLTPPQVEPRRAAPETYRVEHQTILPHIPEQTSSPFQMQRDEHVHTVATLSVDEALGERKQAAGPRVEAVPRSAKESDPSESSQGAAARLVPVLPKLEFPHPPSESKNSLDAKQIAAEETSPTVHIRIGRIEVRAVTQASPPARTVAPSRPKLTLDDYLTRRNEGKR
jgi:hypothetical protein